MSRPILITALLLASCATGPGATIAQTAVTFIPPEASAKVSIRNIADIPVGQVEGAHPNSISRQADGSYLVAGSDGEFHERREAYALALSPDGSKKWEYRADVSTPEDRKESALWVQPFYYDHLMMGDRVLLCGRAGKVLEAGSPELLTLLDAQGHVLQHKSLPHPQGYQGKPFQLLRCVRWMNDILFIGSIGTGLWMTLTDTELNFRWQKLVPQRPGDADAAMAMSFTGIDLRADDAFVSYCDHARTSFVRVTRGGVLIQKVSLPGLYLQVEERTVGLNSRFALIGYRAEQAALKPRLYSLDTQAKTNQVDEMPGARGFGVVRAFRLKDGSLALFGTLQSDAGGRAAAVLEVSPDLKTTSTIRLGGENQSFGPVVVAVHRMPGTDTFEFATFHAAATDEARTVGLSVNEVTFR